MSAVEVTAIAGGTGAAKLLRGLAACLASRDLTVIGNTGDDAEIWGLHVSPDLDTVTYALAGRLDTERGWGLAGETFRCLGAMAELGAETWFNLGDRDLATHLVRTAALRAGTPLSTVTAEIARSLAVDDAHLSHERRPRADANPHGGGQPGRGRLAHVPGVLRAREGARGGAGGRVRGRARGAAGPRRRARRSPRRSSS